MKFKTTNNWNRINASLGVHRYVAFGSLSLSLILAFTVLLQGQRKPIVVVEKNGERSYALGDPDGYRLTEDDVERFIVSYVKNRYTWGRFAPKEIIGRLSCTTTKGFRRKLEKLLGNAKHEDGDVEQYAAFIRHRLEEGRSFATFDRILRINNIPLASPGAVSLDITPGKRTDCNPVGLYVNGTTEYEQ